MFVAAVAEFSLPQRFVGRHIDAAVRARHKRLRRRAMVRRVSQSVAIAAMGVAAVSFDGAALSPRDPQENTHQHRKKEKVFPHEVDAIRNED